MGSVLLCAGTPGKRFALPHSRVMIHQPSGGCEGTAADINIQAQEIMKMKSTLYGIIAKHTGKSVEQIEHDSQRDFFMSAEEAVAYNVVDSVIMPDSAKNAR
jgi:ATP-dependent Clp protease protease subunit